MQNEEQNWIIVKLGDDFMRYELMPYNPGKKTNSFVLIPYKNPGKSTVEISKFSCSDAFKVPVIADYNVFKKSELKLQINGSRQAYIDAVNFLKEQIQLGIIYEINYCLEFFADNVSIDPLLVFARLNEFTKAPYASMAKVGSDYIISASPELFLKKEGNKLYSKPIKGTIKRGKGREEDEELKTQLYNSLKERTENVMAVDVARNDLSRLAKRGTVDVNRLYNIETYETVHHMVSTVSCELENELPFEHIIEATFPMASMTGAPKISAMNLIDKTENFSRNFYSGAMGIIDEKGDFELSVNIRSIFYNHETKRLSIAVGSAITHLCDPEKEYEECLLKANALLRALNAEIEN